MADEELPSPDIVRQLLDYNPSTGILTWLPRTVSMFSPIDLGRWVMSAEKACGAWNKKHAGRRAFTAIKEDDGRYFVGAILGRNYRACRVAWVIHHGAWPIGHVDHFNGDTLNDRIKNLRDVTNRVNHQNAKMSKNNTSGFNGVSWDKQTGKWRALVKVNFRSIHLGRFSDIEDAIAAREKANRDIGFTERHGK